MSEREVLVERQGAIGVVTLNRPSALNALSNALLEQLVALLEELAGDGTVRVAVVTGGPSVFAAGADLKQFAASDAAATLGSPRPGFWDRLRKIPIPLVAAVSGFALGGGCELAMACDLIVASETARFGQPEINVGLIPGAGGTQRLTRAVGKAKAMEMVLTGRVLTAYDAERYGLVNRVVPVEVLGEEALALAREIAMKPPLTARLAKEAVLQAFETTLEAGLAYERRAFAVLFGTEDAHEGMNAFLEKREPTYHGR
ncbi:MAG: enoyl-CoA hydratase [Chloroflexota bacterium]|jgi:enoyl-CoA hydratase|nr:enoyl-CoA hydratase [Chloroflexota bacterium]